MPQLFLSYRRSDTAGYAGRLSSILRKQFGADQVFQDIEAITPGSDFRAAIETAIGNSQVLLVLIGNTWLAELKSQGLRLSDSADFVRLEVATALKQGVKVLPLLVEGAYMPSEEELPADLKALARRQALELSDSRWDYDCERLVKAIEALIKKPSRFKRWLAALTVVALIVIGVIGGIWFSTQRPADISGRWQLPNGSSWLVTQQGADLAIDEVHYESKQVWKRGNGRIEQNHLSFNLDLVFDQHGSSYHGEADVAEDGKLIKGEVVNQGSGQREPLLLNR
ncbi:MAG: toll/interleukin-1 receptor domain-containing protein [Methylococcaceae bacterium]|nr:toll/interleukin-1 receptor domain-containing protein [Methylococcaceae bacterium]MDP3902940.1 toll/interleukin-1 receptor domain-containing protein [Methylococcaceae bacterium]